MAVHELRLRIRGTCVIQTKTHEKHRPAKYVGSFAGFLKLLLGIGRAYDVKIGNVKLRAAEDSCWVMVFVIRLWTHREYPYTQFPEPSSNSRIILVCPSSWNRLLFGRRYYL